MATTPPTLAPGALAEREGVLRALRRHAAALRGLGVSHIFGFSAPWPGAMPGADSDVDVLIAIPSGRKFSLFDLGEVRVELCELLDREVDVVIEEDLVPRFRSDISLDLVKVF